MTRFSLIVALAFIFCIPANAQYLEGKCFVKSCKELLGKDCDTLVFGKFLGKYSKYDEALSRARTNPGVEYIHQMTSTNGVNSFEVYVSNVDSLSQISHKYRIKSCQVPAEKFYFVESDNLAELAKKVVEDDMQAAIHANRCSKRDDILGPRVWGYTLDKSLNTYRGNQELVRDVQITSATVDDQTLFENAFKKMLEIIVSEGFEGLKHSKIRHMNGYWLPKVPMPMFDSHTIYFGLDDYCIYSGEWNSSTYEEDLKWMDKSIKTILSGIGKVKREKKGVPANLDYVYNVDVDGETLRVSLNSKTEKISIHLKFY